MSFCDLASLTSSATDLAGTDGCTTSRFGEVAASVDPEGELDRLAVVVENRQALVKAVTP